MGGPGGQRRPFHPSFLLVWFPSTDSCSSLKLSVSKHHLLQEALPHTQVGLGAPPEHSCCTKDPRPLSRYSTRCVSCLSPSLSCEFSEGLDHVPVIYSFDKYLLNTSCVTGTVLGAADATVTRTGKTTLSWKLCLERGVEMDILVKPQDEINTTSQPG